MKNEVKITTSLITGLISIIVISATLKSIKTKEFLRVYISPIQLSLLIIFSILFSLSFFYLLFSKLGRQKLTGENIIVYLLFTISLSLFLSTILYHIANHLL